MSGLSADDGDESELREKAFDEGIGKGLSIRVS